ncbi:chemotaxis protein CheW [Geobacter sp. SVR]|uniref:chemotaxis protein CheW n=1 Tax=Geobacter sp. SVR TaxID=2495594 RepID=UPI00156740D2|nr:chemotaxis protein CheW [Geobacter sp. SVR]
MNKELTEIQLACFSLGETLFAVDIMRIREIVQPQRLSCLPGSSSMVEGVINLRGNIIPVMNLRRRFGLPPVPEDKPAKFLIVSLARQALALVVDEVLEVIAVPAGDIKPPPDVDEGVGAEWLLGVCLSQERLFMILDIDSLLG